MKSLFGVVVVPITAIIIACAFVANLAGCPSPAPTPPSQTPADAADATTPPVPLADSAPQNEDAAPGAFSCSLACANLATHKCPSGLSASCAAVCTSTVGTPFNVNPDCLRAAADLAGLRACGDPCPGGQ